MCVWKTVFVLLFCMLAFVVQASKLERNLPVSLFITANQGTPGLEIVADEHVFQLVYDNTLQTFSPLYIPFSVRSPSGQNVTYDLFMSQQGGRCDGTPHDLIVVSKVGGETIIQGEKYRFAGIKNEHGVVISFPVITQTDYVKLCEGHIGVIAELVV